MEKSHNTEPGYFRDQKPLSFERLPGLLQNYLTIGDITDEIRVFSHDCLTTNVVITVWQIDLRVAPVFPISWCSHICVIQFF